MRKLCTKFVSFTRLYRDAWSTEHNIKKNFCIKIYYTKIIVTDYTILTFCVFMSQWDVTLKNILWMQ